MLRRPTTVEKQLKGRTNSVLSLNIHLGVYATSPKNLEVGCFREACGCDQYHLSVIKYAIVVVKILNYVIFGEQLFPCNCVLSYLSSKSGTMLHKMRGAISPVPSL